MFIIKIKILKKSIYLFICLSICLSISLNGQELNRQETPKGTSIERNTIFNLEELKVRWKKAALENCPGVPCPTFSVPGPCSLIVATPTSPSSASVSFVAPASDGGSAITGYIVTATSTPSAPAKRKSSAIITVSGTSSPIVVTGLTFGVNYIFSVVATNAAGGSPTVTTTMTVTPCTLNTAGTASSSPTLTVNTALTPSITIATTIATGIGTASGLPDGATAVWSANVITISGTPTSAGTFNYTIPLSGGCGSVNATGTITVAAPFTCGTSTVADIDGNTYNIVTIGTQCWTKENLKVTMYNDTTSIPLVTKGTWAATTGAYAIYDNQACSETNATNYGFLYNWYAAAGIVTSSGAPTKNICPTGWHVPTDSDWNKLVIFIDSGADTTGALTNEQSATAGDKLKKNDPLWTTTNTGTDDFYFSALPGGVRENDGSFNNISSFAYLWSATQTTVGSTAWIRYLYYFKGSVDRDSANKSVGASVRCLRD